MLSDFLLLEEYFEGPETAQFYEDISKKYGVEAIQKAIAAGHIVHKKIMCSRVCQDRLLWLSDKGRNVALQENIS